MVSTYLLRLSNFNLCKSKNVFCLRYPYVRAKFFVRTCNKMNINSINKVYSLILFEGKLADRFTIRQTA